MLFSKVVDVVFDCYGILSSCCTQHDLMLWWDFFSTILFECYSVSIRQQCFDLTATVHAEVCVPSDIRALASLFF
jgi:hypothetical protein